MAAHLSEMSDILLSPCTLLSKVVTTYTTLATLRLWKVAKVVQSSIGHFPDVMVRVMAKPSYTMLLLTGTDLRLGLC